SCITRRNHLSFPTRRSSDLHHRHHRRPDPPPRPEGLIPSSSSFCLPHSLPLQPPHGPVPCGVSFCAGRFSVQIVRPLAYIRATRSEEHTSELQSREKIVCRL